MLPGCGCAVASDPTELTGTGTGCAHRGSAHADTEVCSTSCTNCVRGALRRARGPARGGTRRHRRVNGQPVRAVFTGIVRSTVDGIMPAWLRFYRNSSTGSRTESRRLSRCTSMPRRSSSVPGSTTWGPASGCDRISGCLRDGRGGQSIAADPTMTPRAAIQPNVSAVVLSRLDSAGTRPASPFRISTPLQSTAVDPPGEKKRDVRTRDRRGSAARRAAARRSAVPFEIRKTRAC